MTSSLTFYPDHCGRYASEKSSRLSIRAMKGLGGRNIGLREIAALVEQRRV
jgi:hypothetical protein